MYRILISVFMIFLLTCGFSYAKEYGGSFVITGIKTKDQSIRVSSINGLGSVYVVWRVRTLMEEPVVDCKGVVIIPEKSKYYTTFNGKSYEVPAEIIKGIKVISVTVAAHVSAQAFMEFDLGAMGDIYFGPALHIPGLSEQDKNRYFSYNVSGSPDWDTFFHNNLGLTRGYLAKDQAKKIFSDGIEIFNLFSYAEAEFDLTPVKKWIENQVKDINTSSIRTDDPFKKFEKMDSEGLNQEQNKMNLDIRNFILEKCGKYYTKVKEGEQGFHLTAEYFAETAEQKAKRSKEAKENERKRKARVRKAMSDALNGLPGLQRQWQEKRAAIKGECRTFIMKKYALNHSVEALEKALNTNFTSIDTFEAVYYISYDGYKIN